MWQNLPRLYSHWSYSSTTTDLNRVKLNGNSSAVFTIDAIHDHDVIHKRRGLALHKGWPFHLPTFVHVANKHNQFSSQALNPCGLKHCWWYWSRQRCPLRSDLKALIWLTLTHLSWTSVGGQLRDVSQASQVQFSHVWQGPLLQIYLIIPNSCKCEKKPSVARGCSPFCWFWRWSFPHWLKACLRFLDFPSRHYSLLGITRMFTQYYMYSLLYICHCKHFDLLSGQLLWKIWANVVTLLPLHLLSLDARSRLWLKVENDRIPTPDHFIASSIVFLFEAYVCLILLLLGTFR